MSFVKGQSEKTRVDFMIHVDIARLRDVAETDDLVFTPEEFHHLKRCADCFLIWVEFIKVASWTLKEGTAVLAPAKKAQPHSRESPRKPRRKK